jgi:hypothetical protein
MQPNRPNTDRPDPLVQTPAESRPDNIIKLPLPAAVQPDWKQRLLETGAKLQRLQKADIWSQI